MPEVWGDWWGDLTGWGTLEDKGKFTGVGCLWAGGEAGGAGVGKLHGKEPSEMDLGAGASRLGSTEVEPCLPWPANSLALGQPDLRAVRLLTCCSSPGGTRLFMRPER